jgi:ATP-dependent Lon protease
MEYEHTEDKDASPWILGSLKPIQSIGFNPEYFSRRSKLMQLVRLIPFCERNYNLIELGSKGTRKSHIYSDFHHMVY